MEYIEDFEVIKCPITGKFEKIWYRKITETGFFECNGCDNHRAEPTCVECCQKVIDLVAS